MEAAARALELKQSIPVDDLLPLFRNRRISIERTSACRELSVGPDDSSGGGDLPCFLLLDTAGSAGERLSSNGVQGRVPSVLKKPDSRAAAEAADVEPPAVEPAAPGTPAVRGPDLERARDNQTVIINVSPLILNLETPPMATAVPFLLVTGQEALVILADAGLEPGRKCTPAGGLHNHDDHQFRERSSGPSRFSRVFGAERLRNSPVFAKMYARGTRSGRILFTDEIGDKPA